MAFKYFVYVYIILSVALKAVAGISSKRKLCVEYRTSGGHRNANFLAVSHYESESKCLQQCCRLPRCTAYNYIQNGTCQLLPSIGACNAPEKLPGSSYVHLGDCRGETVWQVGHTEMKEKPCLIWHSPVVDSDICPPEILRGADNKYCAGLGVNKGLYLPGWYQKGKFRAVSEAGIKLFCPGGYFLQVRPNCSSSWQDYTVGDPVPAQAEQVSVWKDGSPLYMVTKRFGFWYFGYYLPSEKRTFMVIRQVESPTNVKILILQ